MQTPFIIVIGGPNGVGKSTFAMEYLRLLPERIEYIDPDIKETMFRVRQRVSSGGHNVPDEVQQRRFQRCYENFRDVYRDICHEWSTHDVSERWR